MTDETATGERIAKVMARAGVASRRDAEKMILAGRVAVNGTVTTSPALDVMPSDKVTLDGKPIDAPQPARLWLYYKPVGLVTSAKDEKGRQTVFDTMPEGMPRVMSVGRLDLNSEGLLLLTNDGELKRAMELPSSGIPRTYRARTFGDISQTRLEDLIEGITIDGMHYGKIDANMERRTGRNQWIELTLTEGKNREVRRVLEHLGLKVSRLLRTSYGPFQLADLPRGAAVEIRQVDVERFVRGLRGGQAIAPVAAGAPAPRRRPGPQPAAEERRSKVPPSRARRPSARGSRKP